MDCGRPKLGRKNWLFFWGEAAAKQDGIAQRVLVTYKLYDIDSYDYVVDVLQRLAGIRHQAAWIYATFMETNVRASTVAVGAVAAFYVASIDAT